MKTVMVAENAAMGNVTRDGRNWNKLNRSLHRDLGYFFLGLIIVYCVSGIALNHVNDWNPDFILEKKTVAISRDAAKGKPDEAEIRSFGRLVGEADFKTYDFPTPEQLKVYYDNASLHIDFASASALYEKLTKRHGIYEVNVLHRNALKQWKWVSDVFGVFLIVIALTGVIIPQGKNGPLRSGKWYVLGGILLPVAGVVGFYMLT